ncbi:hypothetical protein RRG54_04585 [Mycoplasmopsis felis]|uniref:hypothetical protein n=1 Tax=Mycoplasmopsis felis TaxID=33923 RepID=UPI002AF6C05D|nr:hypothetical protein [Mycoplasmopsis felis]WQQ02442.1 hypothetical protein RNN91_03930 [Mycoplasmopsis felis]
MDLKELKMKFWNQIVNNDFNVSQAKEDLILQGMIDDLEIKQENLIKEAKQKNIDPQIAISNKFGEFLETINDINEVNLENLTKWVMRNVDEIKDEKEYYKYLLCFYELKRFEKIKGK